MQRLNSLRGLFTFDVSNLARLLRWPVRGEPVRAMINHAKIYTGQHVLGNAWQGFKPRYLSSSIKTPLGMYKIDLLEVVAGKARKRYVVTDNGR